MKVIHANTDTCDLTIAKGAIATVEGALVFDARRLRRQVNVGLFASDLQWRGSPVFFLRKPASKRFECWSNLPLDAWLISFQGWDERTWFDGPMAKRASTERWHCFVPEGAATSLTFEKLGEPIACQEMDEWRWPALVESFIEAARCLVMEDSRYWFACSQPQLGDYVAWVLLAKAFPHAVFLPHLEHVSSGARRLMQHLGWPTYKVKPWGEPIDLQPLVEQVTPVCWELAKELNRVSAVIPQSLVSN